MFAHSYFCVSAASTPACAALTLLLAVAKYPGNGHGVKDGCGKVLRALFCQYRQGFRQLSLRTEYGNMAGRVFDTKQDVTGMYELVVFDIQRGNTP